MRINTEESEARHYCLLISTEYTAMVPQFVLLAVLVGLAIANPLYQHHSHDGYHQDGHDDYHHGHHGYQASHQEHHGYHGDDNGHGYHGHYDHHHDNIDYKFKYDVKDDKTYNYQSRDEYKDGKNVYGSYSLVEPDGKTRIVKYKADDYGFHADVDYKGGYKHDYKPSYGHHDHHY